MRLTFARAALIAAYFGIAVPFLATADGIDVLRDAETGPEALPAAAVTIRGCGGLLRLDHSRGGALASRTRAT